MERISLRRILRITINVLSIAVLAVIFLAGRTSAATTASITGTVSNGTAGGGAVGGLDVTLTTYINAAPSATQKTTTDDQGRYQFNDLSTDSTYAYDVQVGYKGVQYTSDLIQLTADSPAQTADLKVYETTNSNADVKISSAHMIVMPVSPGVLSVLEVWAFNNSGDRTYIGADDTGATAQFTLPAGATNFSGSPGVVADSTTGIVTDALPIIPGADSTGFSYTLSYQGSNANIAMKADYDTPSFGILVPQNGVVAKSTTLTQSPPQSIQGTTYLYFTGSDLKSGQIVDFALTVSPSAYSTPPTSNPSSAAPSSATASLLKRPWLWVLVAVLGVGLLFALVYPRLKRDRATVAASGSGSDRSIDIEEEVLLERIARLDDRFDAGEINEAEYKERRAKVKASLLAMKSKRAENDHHYRFSQ